MWTSIWIGLAARYSITVAMKNILGRLVALIRGREVPVRLLFVIPLCALPSSQQATAQNNASQILLALSEDERNVAFTRLMQESNEKCDRVLRTYLTALRRAWTIGRCCAVTEIRTRSAFRQR